MKATVMTVALLLAGAAYAQTPPAAAAGTERGASHG